MVSRGQELLGNLLRQCLKPTKILENVRPPWLNGLELDFWLPDLEIGCEFQGDQHYVPAFGVNQCAEQMLRDKTKKQICKDRGVILLVFEASDIKPNNLRHKLFYHLKRRHPGETKGQTKRRVKALMQRSDKQALVKACQDYCRFLRNRYNSPTARRKTSQVRKDAIEKHWAGVTMSERSKAVNRARYKYGLPVTAPWKRPEPVEAPKWGMGVAKVKAMMDEFNSRLAKIHTPTTPAAT